MSSTPLSPPPARKPTRVWVDGCFDLMHFGHANALRQARELGDILVVGVHNDEEIAMHKGPTVMNEQERYTMVKACKWADEVIEGAPYLATLETLEKYNCDFCVHGEDISVDAEGRDVYEKVKQAGKYRTIQRTEGISTTELVGRMLLMSKDHLRSKAAHSPMQSVDSRTLSHHSPYTAMSHFLPTTRRIVQFSESKSPKPTDKIVYIDGGFDLYHVGHVEAIRQAKQLGDYLIVGVHEDGVINQVKGHNFPIMNLHERVLGVLSNRYVDEVVIGAPFSVTKEMIDQLKINVVVHGDDQVPLGPSGEDPYAIPKSLGIYKEVKATPGLTTSDLIRRIVDNRLKYEKRNKSKQEKEVKYIEEHQTK
eukprot:Phypoly_transcript_10054.p1 GENE.Phypoly_transcript_10054~~Phypoly_transcript_10054.p1  ORF type:complete len:365 (+),score=65.80 Phypoly_transcript_10054:224-1318(+)